MEEALATVERHRFSQTSYTTRAAFFATQQASYDFLIDLLMEMHRKAPAAGHAAAALEVNERSLARSLLDGLAAAAPDLRRGGTAPELRARERELEREIDVLVSRQTRLAEDGPLPEQLRSVERDAWRSRWDELDRVRAGLRAGDPRYAALTQPRPWSAAEIQRAARPATPCCWSTGWARSGASSGPSRSESLADLRCSRGAPRSSSVARRAGDLLARSRSPKAERSAASAARQAEPAAPRSGGAAPPRASACWWWATASSRACPSPPCRSRARRRAAGRPPRGRHPAVGVGAGGAPPGGRRPAAGAEDPVGAGRSRLRRPLRAAAVHPGRGRRRSCELAPAAERVRGLGPGGEPRGGPRRRPARLSASCTSPPTTRSPPPSGRRPAGARPGRPARPAARTASSTSPTSTSWTCGPTSWC